MYLLSDHGAGDPVRRLFCSELFGISLGVLRVAGGLILFSAGWLALNNTSSSSEGEEEVESTAGAHKPRTDQDWMKLAFIRLRCRSL